MKAVFALLAGVLSVQTASAQVAPVTIMQEPNVGVIDNTFYQGLSGDRRTPTMQREQLARAIALRAEAEGLLNSDGGKLSAAHERYIRRKACDILNPTASRTGSLAPDPTRPCPG
jgi:secreted protein with Ig-like and vWFA domain